MHYEGTIYRPPSEANSILLQITTGCSHNRCTFCEMYRDKRFTVKEMGTIMADINFAAAHFPHHRKLFLCDGDALVVPQAKLVEILRAIRRHLPGLARVATYANVKSIRFKSDEELAELVELGLTMACVGLESGDDVTLAAIDKGNDSAQAIAQCTRLHRAGFKLSLTVLLGIAGIARSEIHARETGRVLTAIDPKFIGALTLMLTPGTPLFADAEAGRFHLPGARGVLRELEIMFETTTLSGGLFHANHASNYLPLRARLPRDRERALSEIRAALRGETSLKSESLRGL